MQYVPNSFFTDVIAAGQEHWVASWRGYMCGLIHAVRSLQCAGFDSIGGPLLRHSSLTLCVPCLYPHRLMKAKLVVVEVFNE